MTKIRLEAESLTLRSYTSESLGFASGGAGAKLASGSGSITTTLDSRFTSGLYKIVVSYFDENDGQSQMELRIGGKLVDSWTFDSDPNVPSGYAEVKRTVSVSQQLAAGTTIELKGTQNKGEYARVDYIEFERVGVTPPISNRAPSAKNDTATTTVAEPVTISVLNNDSDADGDSLTVSKVDGTSSAGGTVVINSNNSLTYTPKATFSGTDRFSYSISDGKGGTDTAVVEVLVNKPSSPVESDGAAKIRLEAESLTLRSYTSESLGFASGGAGAKLASGSGSITTTLDSRFTSGLYKIVVSYFDENDGQSQMELRIGGKLVDSWTFDSDPNVPSGYAEVKRTVSVSQQLAAGTTIELKGTQNKGEYARVDYIEFERVGVTPPISNRAPSAKNDTATTTVAEPVTISVLNNDSDADGDSLTVSKVDGTSSAGGTVVINSNNSLTYTPKATFSGTDRFSYSISDGKGGTDTAVVEVLVNKPSSPVESDGAAKIRLEAESLTLRSYTSESLGFASGGAGAKLASGSGSITTTLDSRFTSGLYKIVVSYFDENDGQSQMELRIGGKLVDSWTFDSDPNVPSGYAEVKRTVSVSQQLAAGTTIELKGTQNKGEYARVDYIEFERVGATPPPPPANNNKGAGIISNLNTNVSLAPLFGAIDTPRILPLGDSLTAGEHRESSVPGAYRIQFWDRAVADGFALDFVGSENNKSGSLTDGDHAGFPGRTIEQTTAWVRSGELAKYPADAILLMIGSNDANNNVTGAQMSAQLSTLIDAITSVAPNTYLFVSPIPPIDAPRGSATKSKNVADYNSSIPDLVAQKAAQNKRVSYVAAGNSLLVGDLNGDNSSSVHFIDGLHPSVAGYDKLGNAWYDKVLNPKQLTGKNLSGTQFEDRLIGNSSSNVIEGKGGRDWLTGGGGSDIFVYNSPEEGKDIISDFSNDDMFQISAAKFGGGLVKDMLLDSLSFIMGSNPTAKGNSAAFLYNTGNHTFSFDRDGAGSASAFDIATLSNGYSLQRNQIQIVA